GCAPRPVAWSTRSASIVDPPVTRRGPAGPGHRSWLLASGAVALLVLAPLASLAWVALGGSEGLWAHLIVYVLPSATRDSLVLLAGVGVLTAVMGTGLAWLVTAYDFPGR